MKVDAWERIHSRDIAKENIVRKAHNLYHAGGIKNPLVFFV
jgi:hypothetical protein